MCDTTAPPRAAGVLATVDLGRDEIVLAIGGAPLRFAVEDARRVGSALVNAVRARDAALLIDETFAPVSPSRAGEGGAAVHPVAHPAAPSDPAFDTQQGVY